MSTSLLSFGKIIRRLPGPQQKVPLSGLKNNRLQRETRISLEASYWHLPETPSHNFLQKVRG
jgi:hypothetical protein